LCDMQFLRGYIFHLADPVVASLNELDLEKRSIFLEDMARIGDALKEVTGAYRINYFISIRQKTTPLKEWMNGGPSVWTGCNITISTK